MFIKPFTKKMGIGFVLVASLAGSFYACKTTSTITTTPVAAARMPRILVFSKTKGWYHSSIPAGIAAIQKLGRDHHFRVDTTKNADYFREDSLKNYSAIVFLSTTMNVLNPDQQLAFERYIQAGGGFAGIHAAADTEYNWPWYNRLVGAYFAGHPDVQQATVEVLDTTHLSTKGLPTQWERTDEWYNYKNINPSVKVLARPFFMGSPGWVRSNACTWLFSSQQKTSACSGASR